MCSEPSHPAAGAGAGRRRRGVPGGRRAAALPLAVLLAAAALAGGLAACGKRGDPSPPLRQVPQTTEALTVSQRHLDLVLELPYPKTTAAGMALAGLERIEVWEVRRPAPGTAGVAAPAAQTAAVEEGEAEGAEPEEAAAEAEEAMAAGVERGEAEPAEAAAEGEASADEQPVAAPAPAAGDPGAAPPPLDPRQFALAARLRAELTGAELSEAVVGERIVVRLPLAPTFPAVPEALHLAVRTVAPGNERSELSNQVVIVPRPPPPAPGGLAAEPGPGGVRLTWQADGPEVIGYDVYRRGAQERLFLDPLARLPAGAGDHFDDTARFGERYIYAVTAVAARQPTIASAVAATIEVDYRDRFPPAAPAGLVALVEEGRVRLVWEAAQAADLAGYRVSRSREGDPFQPLGDGLVATSEWVDETVTADTTYTWRVASVDRDGNASEPVEVSARAR